MKSYFRTRYYVHYAKEENASSQVPMPSNLTTTVPMPGDLVGSPPLNIYYKVMSDDTVRVPFSGDYNKLKNKPRLNEETLQGDVAYTVLSPEEIDELFNEGE